MIDVGRHSETDRDGYRDRASETRRRYLRPSIEELHSIPFTPGRWLRV
jgi:hypothetical protein